MSRPVDQDFLYQMRVELGDAMSNLRKAYNAKPIERRVYAVEAADGMEDAAKRLRDELKRSS